MSINHINFHKNIKIDDSLLFDFISVNVVVNFVQHFFEKWRILAFYPMLFNKIADDMARFIQYFGSLNLVAIREIKRLDD